jgi:hypothetical protein
MLEPAAGSTLSGSTVTFRWSAGAGVSSYYLRVGNASGERDIYDADQEQRLSVTVTGIPVDGRTIYVRLMSLIRDDWRYEDYTYKAFAQPAAAPTVTLSAEPAAISRGESATLRWSSTNATSASLAPGIGDVPVNGSREVSPTETTTYTITVTGPGGQASKSATVTVRATGNFVISNLRVGPVRQGLTEILLPMMVDFVDPSGTAYCDYLERDILITANMGSLLEVHSTGKVKVSGRPCLTSGTLDLTEGFSPRAFFTSGAMLSIRIVLINAAGMRSNELTGTYRVE